MPSIDLGQVVGSVGPAGPKGDNGDDTYTAVAAAGYAGTRAQFYNALTGIDGMEVTSNKVTSLSSSNTDTQYPSAKAVYTELNTVKTSVSEGKALVAEAVTDKGVETASDATFTTIADNISRIQTGGGDTSDATAVAADILAPQTAYIATGKVTGTMVDVNSVYF